MSHEEKLLYMFEKLANSSISPTARPPRSKTPTWIPSVPRSSDVRHCPRSPWQNLGGCGTVAATKSSRPPRQCGPRDGIGASLPKALDQYYRVTRVLFGGIELTLTDRWEEGAEEIEDGVSAPLLHCRTRCRLSEDSGGLK